MVITLMAIGEADMDPDGQVISFVLIPTLWVGGIVGLSVGADHFMPV